jgi:hypothetical protein
MSRLSVSNAVFGLVASMFFLASCSSGQSNGVPGALVPFHSTSQGSSRGLQPPHKHTLLYAATYSGGYSGPAPAVYVFSYPSLKHVATITGFNQYVKLGGLCSDSHGNVFVTAWFWNATNSLIYEFAHGGTTPINVLSDPGTAFACAVDPTTGNLAVTNLAGYYGSGNHGNVAIFANASGSPAIYTDKDIWWYEYCTYNEDGTLFVDGYTEYGSSIAYMPPGSPQSFTNLKINVTGLTPLSVQWYNGKLTVADSAVKGPSMIYQFRVRQNKGTLENIVRLQSRGLKGNWPVQFLIDGSTVMGAPRDPLMFWSYPHGGHPTREIERVARNVHWIGMALSR